MRTQLSIAAVLAAAGPLVAAAPARDLHRRQVDFAWGSEKVRGVNIGGWLVIEPFITPSIFEKYSTDDSPVGDEWTLCEKLGHDGCYDVLKAHWDSFATFEDFRKIRDAGFNVVRVPVGYWSFVNPWGPYVQGAAMYLDAAIDWARQLGLKVMIDLHGAPKSQNGFDHSGHKSSTPDWGDADSVAYTHTTLMEIEKKYAIPSMQDVVIAIQILNEPYLQKLNQETVKQFYKDAYYNLRQISDTPAMMHDGFWNPTWMNNFLTPSSDGAQNVIVDHHEYQIFSSDMIAMSVEQHLNMTCMATSSYAYADKWTIVGEWSGALTDCAPYLNGFPSPGTRTEGTFPDSSYITSCAGKSGPVSSWTQEWKDSVRMYIEAQLDAFEQTTQGWVFWNFKTEGSAGEWDLGQLLEGGVFPQPLGNRRFGKHC